MTAAAGSLTTTAAQAVAGLIETVAQMTDAELRAAWREADEIWLSDDEARHIVRRLTGAEMGRRDRRARGVVNLADIMARERAVRRTGRTGGAPR